MKPDCANCVGLCCVALAYDRSSQFDFDKAAGEACRHLDARYRCVIHTSLSAQGMGGCVQFDCHGAGQRVTQEIFDGRSWRDEPAIAEAMFAAFSAMLEIHGVLLLIDAARRLPLSAPLREQRAAIEAELDPSEPWSQVSLSAAIAAGVVPRARAFLKSLGAQPQIESLRPSVRSIR
ncbi:MAG: hypothetical protein ACOH2N_18470 [Devosia sp.]